MPSPDLRSLKTSLEQMCDLLGSCVPCTPGPQPGHHESFAQYHSGEPADYSAFYDDEGRPSEPAHEREARERELRGRLHGRGVRGANPDTGETRPYPPARNAMYDAPHDPRERFWELTRRGQAGDVDHHTLAEVEDLESRIGEREAERIRNAVWRERREKGGREPRYSEYAEQIPWTGSDPTEGSSERKPSRPFGPDDPDWHAVRDASVPTEHLTPRQRQLRNWGAVQGEHYDDPRGFPQTQLPHGGRLSPRTRPGQLFAPPGARTAATGTGSFRTGPSSARPVGGPRVRGVAHDFGQRLVDAVGRGWVPNAAYAQFPNHPKNKGGLSRPAWAEMRTPLHALGYEGPSPQKAREILHDGTVHGHPLTPKQRRFMGWKAGKANHSAYATVGPTWPDLRNPTTPYVTDDSWRARSHYSDDDPRFVRGGNPQAGHARLLGTPRPTHAAYSDPQGHPHQSKLEHGFPRGGPRRTGGAFVHPQTDPAHKHFWTGDPDAPIHGHPHPTVHEPHRPSGFYGDEFGPASVHPEHPHPWDEHGDPFAPNTHTQHEEARMRDYDPHGGWAHATGDPHRPEQYPYPGHEAGRDEFARYDDTDYDCTGPGGYPESVPHTPTDDLAAQFASLCDQLAACGPNGYCAYHSGEPNYDANSDGADRPETENYPGRDLWRNRTWN